MLFRKELISIHRPGTVLDPSIALRSPQHTQMQHRLAGITGRACALSRLPLLPPPALCRLGLTWPGLQSFTSFLCSLSHLFFIHSLNTQAIPVQSVPSYAQVRKSHAVGLSALRGFQVVEKTDTESDNVLSGRHREAAVHER